MIIFCTTSPLLGLSSLPQGYYCRCSVCRCYWHCWYCLCCSCGLRRAFRITILHGWTMVTLKAKILKTKTWRNKDLLVSTMLQIEMFHPVITIDFLLPTARGWRRSVFKENWENFTKHRGWFWFFLGIISQLKLRNKNWQCLQQKYPKHEMDPERTDFFFSKCPFLRYYDEFQVSNSAISILWRRLKETHWQNTAWGKRNDTSCRSSP